MYVKYVCMYGCMYVCINILCILSAQVCIRIPRGFFLFAAFAALYVCMYICMYVCMYV